MSYFTFELMMETNTATSICLGDLSAPPTEQQCYQRLGKDTIVVRKIIIKAYKQYKRTV